MVHQRQRLSFRVKSGNDRLRIYSQFDHFQGCAPPEWPLLLRHVDHPPAALANTLEDHVLVDELAQLPIRCFRFLDLIRPGKGFTSPATGSLIADLPFAKKSAWFSHVR
jgi:hypothetical protein